MQAIVDAIRDIFNLLAELLWSSGGGTYGGYLSYIVFELTRLMPPPMVGNHIIFLNMTQGFLVFLPFLAMANHFVDMWVFFQVMTVVILVEVPMLIVYAWKSIKALIPFIG
jgi:hypothetical protein